MNKKVCICCSTKDDVVMIKPEYNTISKMWHCPECGSEELCSEKEYEKMYNDY